VVCRLSHQVGCLTAPPLEATSTTSGPSIKYNSGTVRCLPLRRPVVVSKSSGLLAILPPITPLLVRWAGCPSFLPTQPARQQLALMVRLRSRVCFQAHGIGCHPHRRGSFDVRSRTQGGPHSTDDGIAVGITLVPSRVGRRTFSTEFRMPRSVFSRDSSRRYSGHSPTDVPRSGNDCSTLGKAHLQIHS
jgi:hypothetical protein